MFATSADIEGKETFLCRIFFALLASLGWKRREGLGVYECKNEGCSAVENPEICSQCCQLFFTITSFLQDSLLRTGSLPGSVEKLSLLSIQKFKYLPLIRKFRL